MASLSQMASERGRSIERLSQVVKTQIQQIHISKLNASKMNFYDQGGIEELADSIELAGMIINPLIVRKTDIGEYEVLSGHRRRLAAMLCVERGKKAFEFLPCIVLQVSDDVLKEIEEQLSDTSENAFDVMAKYILITSNSTSRELTDYERMMQAIQLEELIPKIKGDENLKGRALRAEVAKEMNRSNGTIGKYRTIYNHLISEFMDKFKSGDIKVSMAESLAGLPEESQYRLLKISSLTMADIEYEKRQIDQEKTVSESDTEKEAENRISTQCEGDFETVSESDTKKEPKSRINTQYEGDFRTVSESDTKKEPESRINTQYEGDFRTVSESDTEKEAENRISTQCEGDFRAVSESDTEKPPESRISTLYEDDFETENYPEKSICAEKSEKEYTKADIEEQLSKYLSYKRNFKEENKNSKYGRKILLICDALQMLLDNFD